MNSIDKYIVKLQKINDNLVEYTKQALIKSDNLAIKLQQSQMLLGLNADNEEIGGYASYTYEQMKQQMNPLAGGAVDLKLTGAFHNAIKFNVAQTTYSWTSTDSKTDKLVSKYGSSIFGLNISSREKLYTNVRKEFNNIIKNI